MAFARQVAGWNPEQSENEEVRACSNLRIECAREGLNECPLKLRPSTQEAPAPADPQKEEMASRPNHNGASVCIVTNNTVPYVYM